MNPLDTPEAKAAQIQSEADQAPVIDLDEARKDHWLRVLEEARAKGKAAIFGVLGECEAKILPFKKGE